MDDVQIPLCPKNGASAGRLLEGRQEGRKEERKRKIKKEKCERGEGP